MENYFKAVDPFSREHLRDIARFTRLLESMNAARGDNADRRAVAELRQVLDRFKEYLGEHKRVLTERETSEIAAITGSRFPPAVKKRLAEDLIHKIRQRDSDARQAREEQSHIDDEVHELETGKSRLLGWFRLTGFALEYGTITLFTHRLKAVSIDIIRNTMYEWQRMVQEGIMPVLDREYYLLTTLEYNSLALLCELKAPIEAIRGLPANPSYPVREIEIQMDAFARIYATLIKNAVFTESVIQKIFRKRKMPHGLYGMFCNLLDRPIFNNRQLARSAAELIKGSATGTLFSYYSARENHIIRTLHQILHIVQADGRLDDTGKHLTAAASRIEEQNRVQTLSDEQRARDKYSELERIIECYLQGASSLENRMFRIDAGILFQTWTAEHETRPILRLKRLAESFIKHFSSYLSNEGGIVLEYDNKTYPRYLSTVPRIMDSAAHMNLMEFEMTGMKAAEISRVSIQRGADRSEYIARLTQPDAPPFRFSSAENTARDLLLKLGNRGYHLALQLNEHITGYYNQKALIRPGVEQSYDFFLNAKIKPIRNMKAHHILNRNRITLKDFLESACELAFFIAQETGHPGIKSIRSERDTLREQFENLGAEAGIVMDAEREMSMQEQMEAEIVEGLLEKINRIYRDSLTGLFRREYLEDMIMPELYDGGNNYQMNNPRFVFYAEIDGFSGFNESFGFDTADRILVEAGRRMTEHVMAASEGYNAILRDSGGAFIGYLNNTTLPGAVEIMGRITQDVNRIAITAGKDMPVQISLSAGIYEERNGTNVYENIAIARQIMHFVKNRNGNDIGFMKNPLTVVDKRDFNQSGELKDGLIARLHGSDAGDR